MYIKTDKNKWMFGLIEKVSEDFSEQKKMENLEKDYDKDPIRQDLINKIQEKTGALETMNWHQLSTEDMENIFNALK